MGNFAQQTLPLSDSVTLTIVRVNHTLPEVVVVRSLYLHNVLESKNLLQISYLTGHASEQRYHSPILRLGEPIIALL